MKYFFIFFLFLFFHGFIISESTFQVLNYPPIKKITGKYSIHKVKDLMPSFFKGQSIKLKENSNLTLSANRKLIYFKAPGIIFSLYADPNEFGYIASTGWELILEFAPFSKEKKNHQVDYEIIINQKNYGTYFVVYNQQQKISTIQIPIERINTFLGEVSVQIKFPNHPKNFGVLYNAYLTKNK